MRAMAGGALPVGQRWRRALAGLRLGRLVLAGLAVALGGLAAGQGAGCGWGLGRLRINLSPSLPLGVYRLDDAVAARPGDLVLACPPLAFARLALARRYLAPGSCPGGTRPLGKLLLAVPGDRVELAAGGVALDGRPLPATAMRALDAAGRALPRQPAGGRRVAVGEVWVVSPHPLSVDSRCFGPLPASQVLGRLVPLVTMGGADPGLLAASIRRARRGS
jgi:conjugative transfer signal peptidase TraF